MTGLSESQVSVVVKILKAFEGTVIIFGSRATGSHRPDSDLDICLKAKSGNVSLLELGNLREQFEASSLPFRVDLVDYQDLNAQFKEIVDLQGLVLRDGMGARDTGE
jgi:predicted nucleotidyltransferase